jgi:hypothetical protein
MATDLVRCGRVVLLASLLIVASLPLAGCERPMKRVTVSGNVTLDGKPLQGGILSFHPDASKGNNARVSCTGPVSNGRYNLISASVARTDTGTGAPLGWFKVTLINDMSGSGAIKVHERFLQPQTTTVSIEIVEDPQPGAYDIAFTTN